MNPITSSEASDIDPDGENGDWYPGYAMFGPALDHVANVRCPWEGKVVAMLWRDTARGSSDRLALMTAQTAEILAEACSDEFAAEDVLQRSNAVDWCENRAHTWLLSDGDLGRGEQHATAERVDMRVFNLRARRTLP